MVDEMLSTASMVDNSLVAFSFGSLFRPVISAIILGFAIYYVYLRYFSSLAKIPGPPFVAFSRIWLAYHSSKGDMHKVIPQLHKHYGRLVRIAPNEVSVADLNAIREIYGKCRLTFDIKQSLGEADRNSLAGPGSKYRKSDWYSTFHYLFFHSTPN